MGVNRATEAVGLILTIILMLGFVILAVDTIRRRLARPSPGDLARDDIAPVIPLLRGRPAKPPPDVPGQPGHSHDKE